MLHTRRSSRLSEGSRPRPLDYTVEYSGKIPVPEIISGERADLERRLSITREESHPRNRLYFGDNLPVLRSLLDDPEVKGKVELVYIDPPYATGAVFESRHGRKAYEDCALGCKYLEFIRQRLILLREVLSPNGSIYVHLDDTMAFSVKLILDEIFGPARFRNWITRKKSNRKNSTKNQYGNISDYIAFYSKGDNYIWNRPHEAWTPEWAQREYPYIEQGTGRRYKKVPIHAPGVRNGETGKPWRGKLPPPGKHWQFRPSELDAMDENGEIYWSPNNNPRRKIYLDQSNGVPIQDIWLDCRDAHNQMIEVTGYPTEKPLNLMQRIVAASSNPAGLVLDCFAGSGTTLVAAEELGRRWIGIDSSNEGIATTISRLALGTEKMGDFVSGRKEAQPGLFPHPSALRTCFDLYTISNHQLSPQIINEWRCLFGRGPRVPQ